MAVDTAAKRKRALDAGMGWGTPLPDGTLEAVDRAHLLGLYHAAELIVGPYRVVKATTFAPGAARAATFAPGAVRATTFAPGARRSQTT